MKDADDNHAMLEAVLADERRAVNDYTERSRDAGAYGDKGLAVTLEDMSADETGHAEEVERMRRDWSV